MTTGTAAHPVAWARLVRPSTMVAAAAAVAVGAAVSGDVSGSVWPAMTATALAVASANVFNDVHDVAADAVNQPDRPLPAGRVNLEDARRAAPMLAVGAVGAAWPIGPYHVAWVATLVILGFGYSWRLKRLGPAGNLGVAFLFANTILFGASVGAGIDGRALLGAAEVGLVVLGREILKAVPDVEGDARSGVDTVAVRWGWRRAVAGFVAVTSLSLVVAAGAWAAGKAPAVHVAAMGIGVVIPSTVIGIRILGTEQAGAIRRLLGVTRWMWVSGLGAVLVLAPAPPACC